MRLTSTSGWLVPIVLFCGCAVAVTEDPGRSSDDIEAPDGGAAWNADADADPSSPSTGTGGTPAGTGAAASGGVGASGATTSTGGTSSTGGAGSLTGTGGTAAPLFPPPVDVTTLPPSANNPPECPAVAPENPVGSCLGLPVYLNCQWANDQRTYSCVCDWYHWLCL